MVLKYRISWRAIVSAHSHCILFFALNRAPSGRLFIKYGQADTAAATSHPFIVCAALRTRASFPALLGAVYFAFPFTAWN